jgi:hypothetical protein
LLHHHLLYTSHKVCFYPFPCLLVSCIFPFFLVFKIAKHEICFSISFISYFKIFSNFSFFLNLVDYVCSYPCDFLGFG